MEWKKEKPKPSSEFILIAASAVNGGYDYTLFQILKTEYEGKWYYGIFTADGDEWGDYADLTADLYMTLPMAKN